MIGGTPLLLARASAGDGERRRRRRLCDCGLCAFRPWSLAIPEPRVNRRMVK